MIETPALVPELDVTDLLASISLYRDVFGFEVLVTRLEEAFAYLAIGRAHVMLQQATGPGRRFRTAALQYPYGRGVNFQIRVVDVIAVRQRVADHEVEIVIDLEERWYRQGGIERGNRQFLVADLDGYLLRFSEDLGSRQA